MAFLVSTRRRTSRGKVGVFNVFGRVFWGTWRGGSDSGGFLSLDPARRGLQKSELRQVFQPSSSLFFAVLLLLLLLLLFCSFCRQNVASRTAAKKKTKTSQVVVTVAPQREFTPLLSYRLNSYFQWLHVCTHFNNTRLLL